MDILSQHIEYLLLRHDCVVVPGFGAFINVWHSARYEGETIFPMEREVRFNAALTHDDGLLSNSFARKYRISFEEGRNLLRKETTSLRDAIAADGEATLGRLGILHDQDGHIVFRPVRRPSQAMQELGFISVPVGGVAEEQRLSKAELTSTEESHSGKEVSATVAEAGLSETSDGKKRKPAREFDTERNYYIAINKIFARTAACFVLVAAVALCLMIPGSHCERTDEASVVPVENIIKKAASVKSRKVAADSVASAKAAEENAKTAVAAEEQEMYHLIVATFHSEKDARLFISQRPECGHRLLIEKSGKTYRVTAERGMNREEIAKYITDKAFTSKFPGAWVWKGIGERKN